MRERERESVRERKRDKKMSPDTYTKATKDFDKKKKADKMSKNLIVIESV